MPTTPASQLTDVLVREAEDRCEAIISALEAGKANVRHRKVRAWRRRSDALKTAFRSKILRLVVLVIVGLAVFNHYYLTAEADPCTDRIEPKIDWYEVEKLVREIRTPAEAANRVGQDIRFIQGHDKSVNKCSDRWSSLHESYSLGSGDCEDGAIAFATLLSDDFEYQVKIVHLIPVRTPSGLSSWPGHAIAVFHVWRTGKWGYASFNDGRSRYRYKYSPAVFNSFDDAVSEFCEGKREVYRVYEFSRNELIEESEFKVAVQGR